MLKRSEFLAGFGASLFVLSQGAAAQPMPGGVLRVGIKLSPTSMDPQFRLAGEQNLLRGCHARLIGMTPDGKPTPGIAQSWRAVGDGRAPLPRRMSPFPSGAFRAWKAQPAAIKFLCVPSRISKS